jgi:hypothetical protein
MPAASFDKKHLISELASHYGIRIDEGDPALAIVVLNQLILEETIQNINSQLRERISQFDLSVQKVEARAGQALGGEVKAAAAEIRKELDGEIRASSLRCRELLRQVHAAHQRPELIRWAAVGLVFGFILFCCGVWLGKVIALG